MNENVWKIVSRTSNTHEKWIDKQRIEWEERMEARACACERGIINETCSSFHQNGPMHKKRIIMCDWGSAKAWHICCIKQTRDVRNTQSRTRWETIEWEKRDVAFELGYLLFIRNAKMQYVIERTFNATMQRRSHNEMRNDIEQNVRRNIWERVQRARLFEILARPQNATNTPKHHYNELVRNACAKPLIFISKCPTKMFWTHYKHISAI